MSLAQIIPKIKKFLISNFPTIGFLSLDPVALEINSDSVRIMKLVRRKNKFIPKFFDEIIFKNQIDIENLTDATKSEEIIKTLKKIKNKYNFQYATVALPENKTYLYQITFPREAMMDIGSAIKFSLEENVPMAATDVNFNYHILRQNDAIVEVVVSVFPKKVICDYTKLLESAGIKIYSYLPESVAVFRSVVKKNDDGLYLLIRFLKDRANITIVKDGAVQYTSSVLVNLVEILENDQFEDEKFKKLSQELNKTMIYWFTSKKDSNQNLKIEKALLVGEDASNIKLIEALESSLKIDVESANVWENCFSVENYVPELKKDEAVKYAVSIGLSFETLN